MSWCHGDRDSETETQSKHKSLEVRRVNRCPLQEERAGGGVGVGGVGL